MDITEEYRALVESASLDWQVAEFVRAVRTAHEHSANEVRAAAIAEIAGIQHGADAFQARVAEY